MKVTLKAEKGGRRYEETVQALKRMLHWQRNPDQFPERVEKMEGIRDEVVNYYLTVRGHTLKGHFGMAKVSLKSMGYHLAEYLTSVDMYSRIEGETRDGLVRLMFLATEMVKAIDPNNPRDFHPYAFSDPEDMEEEED